MYGSFNTKERFYGTDNFQREDGSGSQARLCRFLRECRDVDVYGICGFAKATLREKRFPFSIGVVAENGGDGRERAARAFAALRRDAEASDVEEMPIEEINREIAAVRAEMRKRD